jgi:hypothetical protein
LRFVVIVMGGQLPRRENLAVQYFARLLGETGEGKRVLYAEGVSDESRALDLLATHIIDSRIGERMFGTGEAMRQDILGRDAGRYLDQLFKQGGF